MGTHHYVRRCTSYTKRRSISKMLKEMKIPTSAAIGDWQRRNGGNRSEEKMLEVIKQLLKGLSKKGHILDLYAIIIESGKRDSEKTYKESYD
jgi:hypothetical protein